MKKSSKLYGIGAILTMFGGAGIAENITSGRGSFMISAVIFSIGFGLIVGSYDWGK